MMLGVGLGVDGMMYAIDPESMAVLGVDGARLQALMEDVAPLMSGDGDRRLMFPDDLTTSVLTSAMAGYSARNTAIANNIANADTPGYKRVDVSFESALADAVDADRERLTKARRRALAAFDGASVTRETDEVAPNVMATDTTTMRVDGSNVDPDDEMARLSANQLASQTVVSLLDKRFTQFRTAITGR